MIDKKRKFVCRTQNGKVHKKRAGASRIKGRRRTAGKAVCEEPRQAEGLKAASGNFAGGVVPRQEPAGLVDRKEEGLSPGLK